MYIPVHRKHFFLTATRLSVIDHYVMGLVSLKAHVVLHISGPWSVWAVWISIMQQCQRKGREGSLFLAAAFTMSATPMRNLKCINWYSPDLCSSCQGVSPRNILFTCMYRHRVTGWLNQCMLFVRCVGLYIHMFFVCAPCLHASCQFVFACVCVLRSIGSEWEQVVAQNYRSSWQQ